MHACSYRLLVNFISCKSYCIASAGVSFWKVGSRKLYAVRMMARKRKGAKRVVHVDSGSDSEDKHGMQAAGIKMAGSARSSDSSLLDLSKQTNEVANDSDTVKDQVKKLLHIDEATAVPISVVNLALTSFKCKICLQFMQPPIIFSSRCGNILGCKTCVDEWYAGPHGLTKNCPVCNRERSLPATHQLHGLDDFLKDLQAAVHIQDRSNEQPTQDA